MDAPERDVEHELKILARCEWSEHKEETQNRGQRNASSRGTGRERLSQVHADNKIKGTCLGNSAKQASLLTQLDWSVGLNEKHAYLYIFWQ